MRTRFVVLMAAAVLVLAVFSATAADKPMKQSNIQGSVQMMNKDTSTITIRNGNVKRDVVYSGDTKFLYGHSKDNKPGSLDQVKEGYYMSCSGTFEKGSPKLNAKECVYREAK